MVAVAHLAGPGGPGRVPVGPQITLVLAGHSGMPGCSWLRVSFQTVVHLRPPPQQLVLLLFPEGGGSLQTSSSDPGPGPGRS